ncbi:hypothetical protein BC829DRAFT_416855 [Chytridium lagenaria]|nr:hypothetical protein BC829DRAFT_416855 [Chytridium lagenaria]
MTHFTIKLPIPPSPSDAGADASRSSPLAQDERILLTVELVEGNNNLTAPFVILFHDSLPYCIEAICPHSGGPLYKGNVDMEDLIVGEARHRAVAEPSTVSKDPLIICPWHAFKFNLKTGASDDVEHEEHYAKVVTASLQDESTLLLTFPSVITDAPPRIVSVERFSTKDKKANILTPKPRLSKVVPETAPDIVSNLENINIADTDEEPKSLVGWCIKVLSTADPSEKVRLAFKVRDIWNDGTITEIGSGIPPEEPPRHKGVVMIAPGQVKRLGGGGTKVIWSILPHIILIPLSFPLRNQESRIAILHSLANIEQWAIDLAFDIIARFGDTLVDDLTTDASDFLKVAADEARHFTYLVDRLEALDCKYGDLPIHGGLWDSAKISSSCLLDRLAIVHMVHEARGLDVNPATIAKFERAKDNESTEKLITIHNDEVTHVATGQKWFSWVCALEGKEKYSTFHDIVKELFHGPLKPPFNQEDRARAGLDTQYYIPLSAPPRPPKLTQQQRQQQQKEEQQLEQQNK